MIELTDEMIIRDLNNTVFMSNENTFIIALMIISFVVLGLMFFFSNNKRQKYSALLLLILFEIMGGIIIKNNNFMKNAINNDEWVVITDKVESVKEVTDDDGDTSYFMILEDIGRVSLDSYDEASQYSKNDEVYIVVVKKNGKNESTGVSYPSNYRYVGNN